MFTEIDYQICTNSRSHRICEGSWVKLVPEPVSLNGSHAQVTLEKGQTRRGNLWLVWTVQATLS